MLRRALLAMLVGGIARSAPDDWDAQFRVFLRELNLFILSLNDGIRDQKRWTKVCAEFEKLRKQ